MHLHSTLFQKLLLGTVLVISAACTQSAEFVQPLPTPWPTTDWQESTPEQQGMDSQAVARLVEFGGHNEMDSLLVVRHGKLVVDTYYAPFRKDLKHAINSATKGVLGTLAGIALKDGLLHSTSDPVVGFFPDHAIANLDANKQAVTIEHLLDMTSGVDWKEPLDGFPESLFQMRRGPDWSTFILGRPMAQPPGTAFNYNSGNSHLLSGILTQATKRSAAEFAQQRLLTPLGIGDVTWNKDPQGISTGGFGLYMHPRDMAKIGYLYLHEGKWGEQQILPPQWTEKIRHATVDMRMGSTPAFHYANGWWTIPDRNVHMAVGYHRQLIMVFPKLDLVAVLTGKTHYRFGPLIDLLEAACSSDRPLPANPTANLNLNKRVQEAATEKASAVGTPSALASTVSGRTYRFDKNALDLSTMQLELADKDPRYALVFHNANPLTGSPRVAGPIGLNGLFRASNSATGFPVAVKASWNDASTLSMESLWVSEGFIATYTLRFKGDTVDIAYRDNSGLTAQLHGVSHP